MATITAEATGSPNIPPFLDSLAWAEGTSTSPLTKCDGYDVIVTGIHGPSIFTDFSEHPFNKGGSVQWGKDPNNPADYSTAAGRYQLLERYWPPYCKQLGLSDFSPLSQDLIAIQQIRERKDKLGSALQHIIAGQIEAAVSLCSSTWASLPGNPYGQGKARTIEEFLEKFNEFKEAV